MRIIFDQIKLNEKGNVAIEAALVFPFLVMLLMGVVDVGNALVVNQKVIRAAQMTGDLISRGEDITAGELSEIVDLGMSAIFPAPVSQGGGGNYNVDIISIRFVDDGGGDSTAETCWRRQTGGYSNDTPLVSAENDLNGGIGEGIVAVSVQYNYTPGLGRFLVDDIAMEEVIFVRGRQSPVVHISGGCTGGAV